MEDFGLPGMRGTLVSASYASRRLMRDLGDRLDHDALSRSLRAVAAWWSRDGAALGPASSLRRMTSNGAAPLLRALGYDAESPPAPVNANVAYLDAGAGASHLPVAVTLWGASLDSHLCRASAHGPAAAAPWALGFNGTHLRLWDTARGWARASLDFDLATALAHRGTSRTLCALLHAGSLASITRLAADASDRDGITVRNALRDGVREALELLIGAFVRPGRQSTAALAARVPAAFDQSLTLVYRLLFLLFAESRGLLPVWHPVYRRCYSIDALRSAAERPGRHTGLWASLQAVSRLAHAGCHAGDLIVTPFNGRLFAPARAPLIETARPDDEVVAAALVAMTTSAGAGGRERIAFGDLGVEQLGAVYESVLDYEPRAVSDPAAPRSAAAGRGPARAPARGPDCGPGRVVRLAESGAARKSSGTFYTPRDITDYVVRHALEPLVARASAARILELRVLDPAMGSGAFLVAACRFLAAAYERALVRESGRMAGDVTEGDRATYRRLIAQRCLYGVDVNPMAVQVARLSLWLATLAADKPLSFLDHHLAVGNSLVGAASEDLARRPPTDGRRSHGDAPLPLFAEFDLDAGVRYALGVRRRLAHEPDDTAATIRAKEHSLRTLRSAPGGLARLRAAADVWCAAWFWAADAGPRPAGGEWSDIMAAARGAAPMLARAVLDRRFEQVRATAKRHGFFHWTAEFPEVFFDEDGGRLANPGFDAVMTNPPWDMVRADAGGAARAEGRVAREGLVRFVRESGVYSACGEGHANLYQAFVERCLRLTRSGGRVGLIVPWGLASDRGSRALRRHLFTRCRTDAIVGFDNAEGVFPIHRGVRFLLLSTSPGRATRAVRCWTGLRTPDTLSDLDRPAALDTPAWPAARRTPRGLCVTPARLEAVSGPDLAIPWTTRASDLRLVERWTRAFPALGSPDGWGLSFGRELNATDDRHRMVASGPGLPVVEGKDLEPFRVRRGSGGLCVRRAEDLPGTPLRQAVSRWRLAYRDVAASTNRLTLIAALVPPGHVTVHTVYCLRTPADLRTQAYLCAMLNSFAANFFVRLWVTTHVGTGLLERLPVPRLDPASEPFGRMADLALSLRDSDAGWGTRYASIQAAAALAYGLDPGAFTRILATFPLVDEATREGCARRFRALFRAQTRT